MSGKLNNLKIDLLVFDFLMTPIFAIFIYKPINDFSELNKIAKMLNARTGYWNTEMTEVTALNATVMNLAMVMNVQ